MPARPSRRRSTLQPVRYNAARTIQAFSARLRQQIELDT
jgi:hypothetical protein